MLARKNFVKLFLNPNHDKNLEKFCKTFFEKNYIYLKNLEKYFEKIFFDYID